MKALFAIGTRPELVKLAPLVRRLRDRSHDCVVALTGQHRELITQALSAFDIEPDHNLDVMANARSPAEVLSHALERLHTLILAESPDVVIVQGDTASTLAGALAGFYAKIPVAHVEAGLRTGDLTRPFPEEMHRVATSRVATFHFAPTERAAFQLRSEGTPPERIFVTGNTGVDALLYIAKRLESGAAAAPKLPEIDPAKRLLLTTVHRRESFGEGLQQVCKALARLAKRPDVQIVLPVHPNPNVGATVREALEGLPNVALPPPLDYVSFVDLMRRAYVILTDSGGIQEEAPYLGRPVIVLRRETERPEAVEAGSAALAGLDADRIVAETLRLLDDPDEYARRSAVRAPFGDGAASGRIAATLEAWFSAPSLHF